ncbi:DEAD-box ATP-dependent RNA helicase 28 [Hibiscus syriacus]|uniref:DEAD-box ATP-dependent RNA helicase 28 n=1 Tax=Hibiscus syriacus TaxID=106335 RepID=A0A6A3DA16_HIBSY|nr:DEAD-box ATP-dependent RNA helicase 28 [Hibiscus syriacus]
MTPFIFEAPSDEEPELSESNEEENEEVEEGDEAGDKPSKPNANLNLHGTLLLTPSPWQRNTLAVAPPPLISKSPKSSNKALLQLSRTRPPIPNPINKSEDEDEETKNAADSNRSLRHLKELHSNSFMELNLSRPLLRACENWLHQAYPYSALTGRDMWECSYGFWEDCCVCLTYTRKAVFRPKGFSIRVLILTPARELAVQVHSMIETAQYTDIRCCLIVGGLSLKAQETALRLMPDIVVATPGRMIDHLRNTMSVDLDDLAVLILDEADRLLELGFNAEIHELTLTSLSDPSAKRPSTLTEEVVRIRRMREVNQEAVLLSLCTKTFMSKVIIFSGTKQAAHRLKILFQLAGLQAAELHGDLTQVQRLDALERFRKQEVDFLIATDVAARGLDIIGVETVINYACPRDITSYVHRVGRTARLEEKDMLQEGFQVEESDVAEQSIAKWSQKIEAMEEKFTEAERALRKAEMEATKASVEKEKDYANAIISAQQAEDLKMKEKRKREREKNLPRKKRRKLEAAREMLEDQSEINESHSSSYSQECLDAAFTKLPFCLPVTSVGRASYCKMGLPSTMVRFCLSKGAA